jgi:hypothetical protein
MAVKTALKRDKYTYLHEIKASYTLSGSMGKVRRLGFMLIRLYVMPGRPKRNCVVVNCFTGGWQRTLQNPQITIGQKMGIGR